MKATIYDWRWNETIIEWETKEELFELFLEEISSMYWIELSIEE